MMASYAGYSAVAKYAISATNITAAHTAGMRAFFQNAFGSVFTHESSGHTAMMAQYTTPSGRAMALYVPADRLCPPNGSQLGSALATVR